MVTIYFETEYLTISWDAQAKIVQLVWKGFVEGAEFRAGMDKGLELLYAKKAGLWLADLTEWRMTSIADQNWTAGDWFPRARSQGLKHSAIILPQSVLSRMALNWLRGKINDTEAAYFSELSTAKSWLLEQAQAKAGKR